MAPYAEDMSDVPTAPLVLLEERSYQGIYGSVDELIGDIEAIDVQNDRCPVFDAEGRHLVLTAESDDGPITAILDSDRRPEDLRAILADNLRDRAVQFRLHRRGRRPRPSPQDPMAGRVPKSTVPRVTFANVERASGLYLRSAFAAEAGRSLPRVPTH